MRMALYLALSFILALSVGPAWGQTPPGGDGDVRIVSSFVAAGALVPVECREEAQLFTRTLTRYPRPESWHWVVICDEAGWRRFLRLSGRDEHAAIYASTDLRGRSTYLRGSKLLYPNDLMVDPDGVIAHELAHIRLNTSSETAADGLARTWRRRARGRPH
jgi:hypothetical protein